MGYLFCPFPDSQRNTSASFKNIRFKCELKLHLQIKFPVYIMGLNKTFPAISDTGCYHLFKG